jgi:hypothetical protein
MTLIASVNQQAQATLIPTPINCSLTTRRTVITTGRTLTGRTTAGRTTAGLIAGAAVALLLLSGCAAGQSKIEACAILTTALETVSTDLGEASGLLVTDPEAASTGIAGAAEAYAATIATITNDEVSGPATASSEAVTEFSDVVTVLAADFENGDPETLTVPLDKVQTTFAELQVTCS